MATITYLNGFEHGRVETGAAVTGNLRLYTAITTSGGTPAIDTSTPRSGARCIDFPATAALASDIRHTMAGGGTPTLVNVSFAVRFVGSLPTADCQLVCGVAAAGTFPGTMFRASDSTLCASIGTGNTGSGFSVVPDVWYWCDAQYDVTGTRRSRLNVNGTQLTDATSVVAASTMATWRLGKNVVTTTANGNIRYDDIMCSETSGDYPFGSHEILKMAPDSDGTHSFTNNDFIQGDAGSGFANSATNMWTFIEEVPWGAIDTTDSIQQNVIRSTGYMETNYEASPRSVDATAIAVHGQHDSDGTGANTVSLRLWDGTTEVAMYALIDTSETSVCYTTVPRSTNPSGGAWTQTALNGIRTRWGFSTDVTGSPILHAMMIEAAFPIASTPKSLLPPPNPLLAMIVR